MDFDKGVFESLVRDLEADADTQRDLLTEYLSTSAKLMIELRRAMSAADAIAVSRTAHSLKSSSAMFGALRLSSLCLEIERAAAAKNLALLGTLVSSAETAHASAKRALESMLGAVA